MKILEMNTEKTWRGGERHTFYMLETFRALGIEVELLARKGSPLAERAKEIGIRVHEVKGQVSAFRFLSGKGKEYHILHAQTPRTQGVALLSKPFHKRPVVCTRHVDFKVKGFLSKLKYRHTDVMVALNDPIKNRLEEAGVERIRVIPVMHRFETPNVERAREFLSQVGIETSGKKVIATVSALTDQKDPITTLRAIHELSKLRNDFIFLHFGDGNMMERVRREVKDLGMESFYKLLGFVERPIDFYPIFDLYLTTSINEGMPLSVLDAFYMGVPVVSVDSPALKDMVEGRGFLCPVGDAECLARKMSDVLDGRYDRTIVEEAKEWVMNNFSLERVAREYLDLFEEILREERR